MWNEQQLIYFAGIVDGEGTFYIGQDKKRPKCFNCRLLIVNTDFRLIQWLQKNFGGLVYQRSSKKNPHWKVKYEWIIEKSKILSICKEIKTFLICKKEHAEIMIKFRETFDVKRGKRNAVPEQVHNLRLDLLSQIRKLNHRCSY